MTVHVRTDVLRHDDSDETYPSRKRPNERIVNGTRNSDGRAKQKELLDGLVMFAPDLTNTNAGPRGRQILAMLQTNTVEFPTRFAATAADAAATAGAATIACRCFADRDVKCRQLERVLVPVRQGKLGSAGRS